MNPQEEPTPPIDPPEEQVQEVQAGRIEITVDAGPAGRFRLTIEPLDGEGRPGQESGGYSLTLPPRRDETDESGSRPRIVAARASVPAKASLLDRFRRLSAATRATAARWNLSLGMALFGLSLLVYLATRLIGIENFPIYFFTDEAVQTVLAADLVRDNFVGYDGAFLPTFFRNTYQFNLSLSVYLQLIPYLFFGKSMLVTRATAALVTVLAPVAIGLSLREVFKIPYWWSGALLVSIAPAWFLHSRTAFETALATALYAGFFFLYLLYRTRSPRYLYPAILLGALTFYAYSPAQLYIGLTAALLLLSDARYHWENRAVVARGLGLILLLALPYLRFRLTHEQALGEHLRQLSSYWLEEIPLAEKVSRYIKEYAYGLSPGYWFIENARDLGRHVMKGYGHLLRATLPFLVLGLGITLSRLRQSPYRVLLIAFLVAPAGAAVVEVGITRLLVFVIPASLMIALGISQSLTWMERLRLPRAGLALGLFTLLGLANAAMLRDALTNGPLWYRDYGLHGMQFGARQVFTALEKELARDPDRRVVISPTWANGTDIVARFFLPDPMPAEIASIDGYLFEAKSIEARTLFVLPIYEYERAVESGKFTAIRIEETIPYPTGEPGFHFVRMRYVDDIAAILEAERAERARLREEQISLDGQVVQVRYPLLDMGQIQDAFDGDPISVTRTFEANPYIVDLDLPAPRAITGYDIVIGSARGELVARLYPPGGGEPREIRRAFQGALEAPQVTVDFGESITVERIRIEVHDATQGEIGHVHVWEIVLRE